MSEGTAAGSQGIQVNRAKLRDLAFWGLMGLIVMAFVVWQWAPAHEFAWEYDEGIDTLKARLFLDGYSLHREIWADHPPLFTLLLAAAFTLFGQSVFVGRALVLALSGLGLVAIGCIGRHVAGPLAGLLAVLLLAVLPQFQQLSRLILIGLPSISVALMALAAAFAYRSTRKLGWLTLSGMLFSMSLLIKPLTPPFFLPLSALILLDADPHSPTLRRRLTLWMAFGAIAAGPILLTVVLFGPRALVDQIGGTFLQARRGYGFSLIQNVAKVGDYFFKNNWALYHAGLLSLAAVGLLSLSIRRRWNHLVPLGIWLGSVFAAILFQSPLQDHQLLLLMPAVVVPAGIGVAQAATGLGPVHRAGTGERLLTVVALLSVGLAVGWAPPMLRKDLQQRAYSLGTHSNERTLQRRDALRFLRSDVPPDSVIITDDPMLAFKTGLSVPPALAVTSHKRVEARKLPLSLLIDVSTGVRPSAIIFWTGRLNRVAGYADWVRSNHYCAHRIYYGGRTIYVPCESVGAQLGSEFELTGWNIDTPIVAPGDTLTLTLYWRGLAQTDADYHVFVHMGDAEPVARADGRPRCGEHPTYRWQVGEQVVDRHLLIVREDAAPGVLTVWVGMYDIGTRHRLPVTDARGSPVGDSLQLTQVRVGEPDYEAPSPGYPRNVTIGQSIRLRGCDLASTEASPGETIDVTLYWECLAPMETSHTVFVHLLGPNGRIYGQQDSVPWGGRLPTTHWVIGEVITDEYAVPVPQDAPAGAYSLLAGMYDLQTGIRLAAVDGDGTPLANDSVSLGQVTIHE